LGASSFVHICHTRLKYITRWVQQLESLEWVDTRQSITPDVPTSSTGEFFVIEAPPGLFPQHLQVQKLLAFFRLLTLRSCLTHNFATHSPAHGFIRCLLNAMFRGLRGWVKRIFQHDFFSYLRLCMLAFVLLRAPKRKRRGESGMSKWSHAHVYTFYLWEASSISCIAPASRSFSKAAENAF
jgi:hypothetical protein